MAASAALHLVAVLLWTGEPGPTGPAGDSVAAQTRPQGRGLRAVAARVRTAPTSRPEERARPVPVEVPPPATATATLVRLDSVPVRAPSPAWGDGRDGEGPAADGSGAGEGTAGAGGSGELSPPVPRSLLPDWSPPEEVRGHRVTVRVEVDPRGRPTGRVELVEPSPSESFNRELRRRMTRLEFLPARRDGRPVTGWAQITFTF